jgi:hypothetical protein
VRKKNTPDQVLKCLGPSGARLLLLLHLLLLLLLAACTPPSC